MLLSAFTSYCYGQCWDPRTILRGEAFGKTSIRLHCSPVDIWTTPSWISLANEHILVGIIGLMDHLQKIILMNGLEVWIDHRTETMFQGGGWQLRDIVTPHNRYMFPLVSTIERIMSAVLSRLLKTNSMRIAK